MANIDPNERDELARDIFAGRVVLASESYELADLWLAERLKQRQEKFQKDKDKDKDK